MNLESLPNEILLDIFECLDGFDLLHGFSCLNSRFNLLLYKQFHGYNFNFQSISKRKFDIICQQYLPLIANQVNHLHLYNNDNTPQQIELFFSYIPSISIFTHLRSLRLFYFDSYQRLIQIIDECYHLNNLTHLNLTYDCCLHDQVDFQLIMNKIWSLSKLTHCCFEVSGFEKQIFCPPTILTKSLENICTHGFDFKLTDLYRLFEYTPRLKRIRTHIILFGDNNDYKSSLIPTLINLNIGIFDVFDPSKLISFLQNLPNLCHLTVCLTRNLINGYQWEKLIPHYLPKLKIFALSMSQKFPDNQNIQNRADELINSFQNSFWINEHQWFSRCLICDTTIHLKTSSKTLHIFESNFSDWWNSTYPHDNQQEFYSNIITFYDNTSVDHPFPIAIHLNNIHDLRIKLPITDELQSLIPNLNKLRYLSISSHADTYQSQLQTLLDHAPRLYRLRIEQDRSSPLQRALFKYTNPSIRELNLRNHCFNANGCIKLIDSPLGAQCEELTIQVKNRQHIIMLVERMSNLRFLYIECKDDELLNDYYQ